MSTHFQNKNKSITKAPNLRAFFTEWQDNLNLRVEAQEIKPDTAITYTRGALKFIEWLGNEQPSADAIRRWKADTLQTINARGTKNTSTTINTWLSGLRAFFGWLADMGEIPFNPTQAIKGAKRRGANLSHTRDVLTDREVIRLLAQPNRDKPEGVRDYAILCIMVYTAARGIEIHNANSEDLKNIGGALALKIQGKGHFEKDDFLILSADVENAVRDWLVIRGKDDGALFVSCSNRSKGERLSRISIRAIVKGYINAAGIRGNVTTHSLRHTAITNAIRHGAPIQKVKGMSRHASLDTLMGYFHDLDRLTDPAEKYISYSTE